MVNWFEKRRGVSFILIIFLAVEIFWFSSLQLGGGPGGINLSIAYHFIVFFLFNFFLLATIKGNKKLNVGIIFITLIISLLYSISDEIHQIFVPLRDASFRDILTNSAGIFSSTIIYLFIDKKSTYPSKKEIFHHPPYEEEYENEHEVQSVQQQV